VKAGSYLWAVGGREIDGHTNLDELLSYQVGRQVTLTLASGADGSGRQEVQVRPVDGRTEKALTYREWVEGRRAYVEAASHGRLGYVHMPNMSSGSLSQLFVDLDAQNLKREGVVVDIRNNTGGFVNAYALDALGRRGYMTMTFRDYPPASARSVLGQRSLERPTVLVTNQESLSDAEVMSEGYHALQLGKIVGEPTSGWIIYTSDVTLLDGSFLRLPFVRITDGKGGDMEMHPRPVDVAVNRPVGESYTGHDSQLDAAVRELLQQIEQEKAKGAVVAAGTKNGAAQSGGGAPR
jgi:tricorn protease